MEMLECHHSPYKQSRDSLCPPDPTSCSEEHCFQLFPCVEVNFKNLSYVIESCQDTNFVVFRILANSRWGLGKDNSSAIAKIVDKNELSKNS